MAGTDQTAEKWRSRKTGEADQTTEGELDDLEFGGDGSGLKPLLRAYR
jgi:hypothetical protein